jgi:hypothetical protein
VLDLQDGEPPWKSPLAFRELVDVPPADQVAVGPHRIDFSVVVDDLSVLPPAELARRALDAVARPALLAWRCARDPGGLARRIDPPQARWREARAIPGGQPSANWCCAILCGALATRALTAAAAARREIVLQLASQRFGTLGSDAHAAVAVAAAGAVAAAVAAPLDRALNRILSAGAVADLFAG